MFFNDYFAERERWDSQIKENSARGAWAWGNVHTHGWGEFILPDPIVFGITYTDRPIVSYGFSLDDDEQLVDNQFPRCSGGVLRWIRTPADFYIGAYVFATVAIADPMLAAQAWAAGQGSNFETNLGYDISHSFTFNALAIKDVGGA